MPVTWFDGDGVGAAPFVPTDIGSIALWLDADDAATFTFSSGTLVSDWNDKSGNSRHMTQGVVGRQPTRTGTIGAKSAVNFDGSDDRMVTADPGSNFALPNTIFLVVKGDTFVTSNRNILGSAVSSGTGTVYVPSSAGSSSLALFAGSAISGGTVVTATEYILQVTTDGASSTGRVNGGTDVLTGTPGTTGWRGYGLACYNGTSGIDLWDGLIGEVIVYHAALSLSDVNLAGNYLAAKWGVTWSTAT